MVKSILLICLTVFVVAGICEFINILRTLFYYPEVRIKNYAFIVLKKDNAIKQLNYIWQKIRWNGDSFAVGIIAITDGIDRNEFINCSNFAEDKSIILCTAKTVSRCIDIQGE